MSLSAREAAALAVWNFAEKGVFAAEAIGRLLPQIEQAADRALSAGIVHGTIEKLRLIDYNLERIAARPIGKITPKLRAVLRTSLYQIFFLDRVPAYSVCNEGTALAKQLCGARVSGFANAVLRTADRQGLLHPAEGDALSRFAIEYSLSDSLAAHFFEELGEETALSVMQAFAGRRLLGVVVNNLRISTENYCNLLRQNDIIYHPVTGNLLEVDHAGAVAELPGYAEGFFHIQDPASYCAVLLLGAQQNEKILDLCAAPGGKSFTAFGLAGGSDQFYSFDLTEKKTALLREGAARLGYSIHIAASNASVHRPELEGADRVICDVPCSGYGVIGKKQDIRYKKTDDAARLPEVQRNILENAASYVREGGVLVYSTCTLSRAENDGVIEHFLAAHKEFSLEDARPYLPERFRKGQAGKTITLLPHIAQCDGFYMARLVRK